jgi:hypothetical protein
LDDLAIENGNIVIPVITGKRSELQGGKWALSRKQTGEKVLDTRKPLISFI